MEQKVTHATLPPVLLSELSEDLPLQSLIVAGEACPPEQVARWSVGRRMINDYGPTEMTVCATMSDALSDGRNLAVRLVVRSGTRGFMFWTAACGLCLRGLRGSFTLRVAELRGAILAGLV